MARRHQLPKMLSDPEEISVWNKFTGFSSSPTFDSLFGASLQPKLTKVLLSLSNVAPKLTSLESKQEKDEAETQGQKNQRQTSSS